MNRLTVERVKAAYEKTGATPERYNFWIEGDPPSACAYGAVFVAETGFRRNPEGWDESAPLLHLAESYAAAFVAGFDIRDLGESENPLWRQGYEDGLAAAKAMGLP